MAIRIKVPRWKVWKMQVRRIFSTGFTLMSMLAVALFCALLTMRLAIHGSVQTVPNLAGLTLEEASEKIRDAKLDLTLENRFYSATVPSGRVLSQSPAAGAKVRSGWYVRVTESTGPQKVSIPNTVGQNGRDASMSIRKSLLELGTMAHIPAPGDSEVVLAQTPPPNAEGVDKPQVSILLSAPEAGDADGWVMPDLVGLSLHDAQKRISTAGLRLIAIGPAVPAPAPIPQVAAVQPVGQAAAVAVPVPPVVHVPLSGIVTAQLPQAGYRVSADDAIKVMLNGAHVGGATSAPAPSTPAVVTVPVPVPASPTPAKQ